MIICPILSQQRRAEDGSITWEHHECLKDGCAFWAAEAQDCALRASGLSILREAASRAAQPPSDPAALLSEPLSRLATIEKRMEEIAERSAAGSRDLGIHLLEGVAALEQPVQALREEMDRIREGLRESDSVLDRARALIEDQTRREEERARLGRIDEARECNARGTALFHREMHEAAEAAFRRATELDGTLAEAHSNLGIVLSKLGRPEEAAACFEKAIEIKPDLPGALNNLGFLAHESMDFERAVDLFRRAALSGGEASVAYANLGNALRSLNRRSDAVDAWKKALEKDPLNENAARALRMYEGAET